MKKKIQLLLFCFTVSLVTFSQTNKVTIEELNLKTFKQKVWNFDKNKKFKREGNLPIILDFHATWCGPCKMLAPHLQTLQNKYKGKMIVYKIDVDQEPELAQRFEVNAYPTLVFILKTTSYKTQLGYREYDELEKLTKSEFFQK